MATTDKEPCLIGKKVTIKGSVTGNQELVVEGRIEGRVELTNRITVEQAGEVEADLDVTDASVKGYLRGDLAASRSASLESGSRVIGTIRAPRVVIHDGARFQGTIEMDVDLPADLKAAAGL